MSRMRPISRIRIRRKAVAQFIEEHGWHSRCEIIEIVDHDGPAVDDPTFDAIVVSPETEIFAQKINEKRAAKGHSSLVITVVPWVLADDGKAIAATRIRNGEIGPDGQVFTLPPDWGVRKMPDEVREKLKKPFGRFFEHIRLIRHMRLISLISVGDRITQTLLQEGITPQIAIVDYHIQRKKKFTHFTQHGFGHDVIAAEVKNPAGTMSYVGCAAIRRIAAHAYTSYESYKTYKSYVLIVDGEEDLMVLPAILAAPLGAVVLYGQPEYQSVPGKPPMNDQSGGVVVVEVTVEKKREVMEILNKFQ